MVPDIGADIGADMNTGITADQHWICFGVIQTFGSASFTYHGLISTQAQKFIILEHRVGWPG